MEARRADASESESIARSRRQLFAELLTGDGAHDPSAWCAIGVMSVQPHMQTRTADLVVGTQDVRSRILDQVYSEPHGLGSTSRDVIAHVLAFL